MRRYVHVNGFFLCVFVVFVIVFFSSAHLYTFFFLALSSCANTCAGQSTAIRDSDVTEASVIVMSLSHDLALAASAK